MTIINKIKKTAKDIYNTVKEKVTSWWAKPEGKAEDVVKATYVSLSYVSAFGAAVLVRVLVGFIMSTSAKPISFHKKVAIFVFSYALSEKLGNMAAVYYKNLVLKSVGILKNEGVLA